MIQAEKPETPQIDAKYMRFIAALADAPSLASACRKAKISDDTGRRWLQIPEVKQALDDMTTKAFDQAIERLKRSVNRALDTLETALIDDDPNPVRIRAACYLLEKGIELHKISIVEARCSEIEQFMKKWK